MFDKFVIHVKDRTQGLNRIALVNDKPIGMEISVQFHALHTFFFLFLQTYPLCLMLQIYASLTAESMGKEQVI